MMHKRRINTIKLLMKMIMYNPLMFLINIVLWTLIFVYNIVPGMLTREFFNRITNGAKMDNGILWILVLLLVTAFGNILCVYFGGYVDRIYDFILAGSIKRNMLELVFRKPGAQSINCSSGEALNYFKDDVTCLTELLGWILDLSGCETFLSEKLRHYEK